MACPIRKNARRRNCGGLKGGLIREIAFTKLDYIEQIVTNSAGIVTGFIMKVDPATGAPYHWYQIIAKDGTAGIRNEAQIGNNDFVNQICSFSVDDFSDENKKFFVDCLGAKLVLIGLDALQRRHLVGWNVGAKMTSGAIGTGVANDDLYGLEMEFTSSAVDVTPTVQSGTNITVLSMDDIRTETLSL